MSDSKTLLRTEQHGDIMFDAVLSASHAFEVSVTSYPIQKGASISDHAYEEPNTIELEVAMSDVMADDVTSHSANLFTVIREIMRGMELVTVVTRFEVYQDMLITSVAVPDEYTVMNGIKMSIKLQKVNLVTANIVSVISMTASSKSGAGGGGSSINSTEDDDSESEIHGATIWEDILNLGTFVFGALSGGDGSGGIFETPQERDMHIFELPTRAPTIDPIIKNPNNWKEYTDPETGEKFRIPNRSLD